MATSAACTLPSPAAFAQQIEPTLILDEISVSATSLPTPVRQVGSSVTVITAEEIARTQRRTLPDALAPVPGTSVVQTGGPGGQASVFIRGTSANHVKVLIDGVPVNDPSTPTGAYDFGHLPTADIARIEVLRGPQSGLYGADALGGVISITTKTGKAPPKASLEMEGGSFGTFNQTAQASGGNDRFDYFLSAAHMRTEATPVTPPELVPAGQRINDDSYDNWSFASRFGVNLTESLRLSFIGRYTDALLKNTMDDGWPSAPNPARSAQRNQRFLARAQGEWSMWDGRINNTFGVGYANEDRHNTGPINAYGPGIVNSNLGERTIHDWRTDIAITPEHTLILGLQHERERFDDDMITASSNNAAGFIEWQGKISERLAFAANIRHDDNNDYGGHTTWRFAPTLTLPVTETRLKGSIGTAFKAPSLSQRFADSRPAFDFYGNPDLKPETSTGYDLGFEQPFANEKVLVGATYFHNNINDLINTNTTFTSYTNVGQATTRGVEAFGAVQLTEDVDMRIDYTFTLARDDIARQELLRRPRHKASFTAFWQANDKLRLSATALYVGAFVDGNRDFSITRLRTSGYATVNLAADYQADEQTVLFARVDNLFDRRYENPTGFLRPGLGVYAGLRFSPQ
ncbi:TonB-dependent receptor plug domain-containing protein [Pseudochelatococcus sp. G4_1912]|uniref:TonB-dependent receptor plug domain-containing protein n=1 Tax=Pseudochelatococcus sp. G4_1912 TaxID=3114288 RepID=UPI0039C63725